MNAKLLQISAIAVLSSSVFSGGTSAQQPNDEILKKLLERYPAADANKDGKLNRRERAKISKEDKERLEKAVLGHKKRHESR